LILGNLDIPTNANRKGAFIPISSFDNGHLAAEKGSWTIEDFMCMTMIAAHSMRVTCVPVVGM
jgi:hypothetical protein